MGSLCKTGPATTTTTTNSSSQYKPFARDSMEDIYSRIWSAAETPYTPYGGQMVAGLNDTQRGGISNITGATSYLDTARGYATDAASPIAEGDISRYYNPFTQGVIDATQRQFNESNKAQQSQVTGNAALKGALGGDRVGVAQAETARQQKLAQDPVIAKLESDKYNMALAAAQADRAAKAQGASQFGAMGGQAIAQGQSQIGAGSLDQGTEQARLNAAFQQFQQQQAYPFQTAQFLTSTGLPVLSAQGGKQSGSSVGTQVQQAAQPSPLQIGVGLGTAALGAFTGNPGAIAGGIGAMGGSYGSPMPSTGATYGVSPGTSGMASFGGVPYPVFRRGGAVRPGYARGGFIDRVNELRHAMRRGGAVPGYNAGGATEFPMNLTDPRNRILGVEYGDVEGNPSMFSPPMAMAPEAPPSAPAALPPPITNPGGARPMLPVYANNEQSPLDPVPPQMAEAAPQGGMTDFSAQSRQPFPPAPAQQPGGGLSEEARMGLIAAGLGILASKNPNAIGAIGEGGLVGIKQYTTGKQTKEKNELAARKLLMDAEQFAKSHDLRGKTLDETKRYHDMSLEERRMSAEERSQDRRDALARSGFPGKGKDAEGNVVDGYYQYDPDTRKPVFHPGVVSQKGAAGSGRPPAVLQIADAMIDAREEARKADPKLPALNREEAIKAAQRAPRDREDANQRERLAQNLAKNDPNFTIEKAREFYGLPAKAMPEKKKEPGVFDRLFGGGEKKSDLKPMDPDTLARAKAAIAAGKDRNAVIQRLRENKFDPSGL